MKATLATFADPLNRDVLNQIKFLHRAVSLLQVLFCSVEVAVTCFELAIVFSLFCGFCAALICLDEVFLCAASFARERAALGGCSVA